MLGSKEGFVYQNILLFIVFVTGAVVLVLEITATRILSVYFGSTIYTVSSVISVILLALSVGYRVGGRLADRQGSERLFYQIIAVSGVSVFLLYLLNLFFLPYINRYFSIREGPLVSSLLLFFLPNTFLGMLSPFVAKLQERRLLRSGIGRITGDVFFWSTLGSIIGSLATGFFLIPHFGLDQIIIGSGIILLVIGVLGLAGEPGFSKKIFLLVLLLPSLSIALGIVMLKFTNKGFVYVKDGVYERISIHDGYYRGKPSRFLSQDIDASSAMFRDSSKLVYEYTKYYALYKLIKPDIENALVIGGGAYSVPKVLLQDDVDVVVDVAEIEPGLFELTQKYFDVHDVPRLRNHVEDGRRFLSQTETEYDLIFNDAFHFSIPSHLTTKEFFELSKSKLKPGGIFVGNVIGSFGETSPSFLFSEIKTFQSVYPNSYVFGVNSPTGLNQQNVILMGYNGEEEIDFSGALGLKDEFLQDVLSHLVDTSRFDLNEHSTFTDNYAPVEYFIANSLQ